ncbi:flagellin [Malaciobacter molluscorum LMG 25693]|uniref:Flagellin n=1 Tax=Malaciobacter molluscorum LMG 25693 TaxID=870501 RepID=A0A2G1DIY8_9BACT|nr:flagellin [Malaciobacter molluscorum]AXX93112.1 flagellin [Malaciobacter molluscorum LMG 25693]PHO18374.1 flagellin [Malaciobacter molluscorum LMG 25693]
MILFTNTATLIAYENYSYNNKLLTRSLLRLSTGLRINSASDDPSGLAIADKLRMQATSVSQGIENANSAIALTQIADKAISEQSLIIDTVKAKLIQASTDSNNNEGKEAIRKDIVKLLQQLDNIASQTNYNGNTLLQNAQMDTSISSIKNFFVGESSSDIIQLSSVQANTIGLGLDTLKALSKDTLTSDLARNSLNVLDKALTKLSNFRSEFGSTQNQLESSVRYMLTLKTNLKASESVIRDVDYAKESANLSKFQLIAQAGMFAMAQANKIQELMLRYLFR